MKGQIRTYNKIPTDITDVKLVVTVYALNIKSYKESEMKDILCNQVELIAYIVKKPIYRKTPSGREIVDLSLAVNREYKKTSYIPAIAWGKNARLLQQLEVGTCMKIKGRIQSRDYEKIYSNGIKETKIAYELSIDSFELESLEEAI